MERERERFGCHEGCGQVKGRKTFWDVGGKAGRREREHEESGCTEAKHETRGSAQFGVSARELQCYGDASRR